MVKFEDIFDKPWPLIGMIHLNGSSDKDRFERAIYEIQVYDDYGFDGVIVEDYHGSIEDVERIMDASQYMKLNLVRGVNILRKPYYGFEVADKYGGKFIQFDSVQPEHIDSEIYNELRQEFPDIAVLGGVQFKYQPPTGLSLKQDLERALSCEAIVTTGEGTGIKTPLGKLMDFRALMPRDLPLIVGAGVNEHNSLDQSAVAQGAIVGSGVKINNDTREMVDPSRVKILRELW